MGTALQLSTMRYQFPNVAPVICGFAVLIGIGTQVTMHQLDKATAQQCASHDWPKDAHEVHMAWCAANGYETN
jgi:hypothetical protein